MTGLVLATTITLSAAACSPVVHTRGNIVENDRLSSLTPGISRKADVASVLGTPTTTDPFNDNIWFYMGEKTANKAFFEHEVTERRVLTVTFDETDTLQEIQDIDQTNAKEIEMVEATTPTAGKKMNMFQQFFSNLGKFNTGGTEARTGADL